MLPVQQEVQRLIRTREITLAVDTCHNQRREFVDAASSALPAAPWDPCGCHSFPHGNTHGKSWQVEQPHASFKLSTTLTWHWRRAGASGSRHEPNQTRHAHHDLSTCQLHAKTAATMPYQHHSGNKRVRCHLQERLEVKMGENSVGTIFSVHVEMLARCVAAMYSNIVRSHQRYMTCTHGHTHTHSHL